MIDEQPKSYVEAGNTFWYLSSKRKDYWHRLDGPAIEFRSGRKEWWVDDKLHRLDGPAVKWADETENRPSISLKEWWVNGERHRLDGPAIEWPDGGTKEWWINGKQLPAEEVEIWLKENDVDLSVPEGQMAFKLRWI